MLGVWIAWKKGPIGRNLRHHFTGTEEYILRAMRGRTQQHPAMNGLFSASSALKPARSILIFNAELSSTAEFSI